MKAWENWAMIQDGEVKNVCSFSVGSYTEAQHIATAVYGDGAFAVEVTYIPCGIGDTYTDGEFYDSEGNVISRMPDEETQLDTHTTQIADAEAAIDDLVIAMLEG